MKIYTEIRKKTEKRIKIVEDYIIYEDKKKILTVYSGRAGYDLEDIWRLRHHNRLYYYDYLEDSYSKSSKRIRSDFINYVIDNYYYFICKLDKKIIDKLYDDYYMKSNDKTWKFYFILKLGYYKK